MIILMNKIIWISSYPKSGNTWMRYLIANYFFNSERIFDQKIIKTIKKFPIDDLIKKISTKKELIENPYNISKYWIKSQRLMKVIKGNVTFMKNHNALVSINRQDLTNENHSLASIYIVRDPRDVVISYAKYRNLSYDQSIEELCSKKLFYLIDTKKDFPSIEILGSWKFNYTSWRDGVPNVPKIIVKYENLLENCYDHFYKVISFLSNILNFEINEDQIKFSVDISSFTNLKKNEDLNGFFESDGKSKFFRKGKSGNWKNVLSNSQIKYIEKELNSEMKFLGYL